MVQGLRGRAPPCPLKGLAMSLTIVTAYRISDDSNKVPRSYHVIYCHPYTNFSILLHTVCCVEPASLISEVLHFSDQ